MSSIKKQAIRGAILTIAGYGLGNILRLGTNLILTRLLVPEFFGLLALVNVFIVGLHLFSDIGLGPSIIQNKRGDEPAFLNTAWTMQVIRGIFLWCCCLLIAWPLAHFYNNPQLLWLIPIVGLNTLISGFNSTALYKLGRHLAIGKLMVYEFGAQVIGSSVMIAWAWFNPTVWALVVGSIASSLVQLVWSYWLIPGQSNSFTWDREVVKEIFSLGKWIFMSTAVAFLGMQSDRLILGKLIPISVLGVYGIAMTFSELPRGIASSVSYKVMLPAASKLADLPREVFRVKILQNRRLLLIGCALLVIGLTSFGDLLILALYDKRYVQAAWMLPILALGIWPNLLFETQRQILMAIGVPKYEASGQFLKCLFVCIGLPLGFYLNGLVGAVIVVALNDLPIYGAIAYGLWCEGLSTVKQDIQMTVILFALLTLVLMARYFLGFGFPISGLFHT